MKTATEQLISDLIERTRQTLNDTIRLQQLSTDVLNRHPDQGKWNALECIEHLNLYGDFYLPEISKRINNSGHPAEPVFKSGLLGNYFAQSMLPRETLNKMKTFKDKNPVGKNYDQSVLDRFVAQQHKLLELLDSARKVSLTKTKTAISISSLIRLRLGDTLRVVVYHNQRHLVQAFKAAGVNELTEIHPGPFQPSPGLGVSNGA